MKQEQIKPCPFCGSKKVEVCRTNENACWIRCEKCGADSESDPSRKRAIQIWNRRPKTEGFAKIVFDQETDNQ